MRIVVLASTCAVVLAVLVGAAPISRAGPFAPAPGRIGPFIRPMGPPFMRPFGRPFLRFWWRPPPPVAFGGQLRSGRLFLPPLGRVCFTPAETRQMISSHGLTEPFQALRTSGLEGEALRARLCSWKAGKFVYEVAVLLRDGRLVRVYMDAQNGRSVDDPGRQ